MYGSLLRIKTALINFRKFENATDYACHAPRRHLVKMRCLTACCIVLWLFSIPALADWGAAAPTADSRPTLDWITRFGQKPHVYSTTADLSAAIMRCDAVVGRGNYCMVAIQTSATPFVINRSKTRIVGHDAKAAASSAKILAKAGQASILIGSNVSQVAIDNLQLVGIRSGSQPVYGIMISGRNIRDIAIRNNRLYNFDSDTSAHGVIVLGSGTTHAARITGLTIDGNHLHDLRTGASESISINGNVTDWVVSHNIIERVNNIAIDAIGGEGTVPPHNVDGRVLPHPLDAARNGWIEHNQVTSMSTQTNPAYGLQRSWAGAIYVDGGRRISITDNNVTGAEWAYDIGAENCVIAEHITMMRNRATHSHYGDLRVGGYTKTGFLVDPAINCDPHSTTDDVEGHGYVRRVTVADNRFESVNTELPPVFLEYRTTESIIIDPSIAAASNAGAADGNSYRISW